ncbi:hypothetical protein [Rhodoplanes azumiensis]|uniref:Uncharacterized protein n=1 Tax=Rhodoplanes azumiensis TaxID=1897628 RepID=A0ABW5AEK1_9BRAD
MRPVRPFPTALLAAILAAGLAGPAPAQNPAQSPAQAPARAPAKPPSASAPPTAAPRPYASIAVTMPKPVADPSFEAFRKQLGEIAGRKDRAALAGLVAKGFFWTAAQGEKADRKKSGIDNLAAALGLDAADGEGWEALASAAADPTLEAVPQKKGVSCAPAAPAFDGKAFEQLLKSTRSDVFDWAFPALADLPVRSGPAADAPVVETLGAVLVRVVAEPPPGGAPGAAPAGPGTPPQAGAPPAGGPPADPPGASQTAAAAPPLKVVTPSGKTGFVSADAVLPLVFEQLCYIKDASGWKIAGYLGGE